MALPGRIVICSHRLGGTDGVSIEAAKWQAVFERSGCSVRTAAASGPVDVTLAGLSADGDVAPSSDELDFAFQDADLVVVENVCSLKLNPAAATAVSAALHGRTALFHHHDLAVERAGLESLGPPEDDERWTHVCISHHASDVLSAFGIEASTLYNHFDPDPPLDGRERVRTALGLSSQDCLVLQPTRAIARKAIAVGVELTTAMSGVYWLLGDAEDGYGEELESILENAAVRVLGRDAMPPKATIDDAYASSDIVAFPSTWEGFGNPSIESATHRRPLAIGTYPVARELEALGFTWFPASDHAAITEFMKSPDPAVFDHNAAVARAHFSLDDLPSRLWRIVEAAMERS